MAGLALSTIGVIFGYGLGTLTTPPTSWTQIEECVSIGGVEVDVKDTEVNEINKLYNKDSIESLSPLEFTRLRPGVYAGDTTYSTQLLVEIVSIAEFKENSAIEI